MKKEFKIIWKGNEQDIVIKKLTFGERNDLQEQVTQVKYIGTIPQIKVSTGKLKELSILKSLVKAPFKISLPEIKELPNEIGEQIYKEVDKFNKLSEEKKEN